MTIDASETTVLEPAEAAAPDLAWSLSSDEPEVLSPGDPVERYGWGLVWRNAALLVVAAVLAAALLVFLGDRHEPPSAAAAAPAPASTPMPTMGLAADADAPTTVPAQPQSGPADRLFLAELARAGIPVYFSSVSIGDGHQVCENIAAGETPQQQVPLFLYGRTAEQARAYVAAAIDAYCPSR